MLSLKNIIEKRKHGRMALTVRPAQERDFEDILRLLLDIANLHHEGRPDLFSRGGTKYTRQELYKICEDPDTPVFIAEDGGGVLGYVFCRIECTPAHGAALATKVVFIDDICVDESKRKSGVGAALFARAEMLGRERGCQSLELNLWEFNAPAARFYEKMGMSTKKRVLEKKL